MASALAAPPRAHRSPPEAQSVPRPIRPMPAPISRVALAARQNQILALQALQTASVNSAGTRSPSTSAHGSPPPNSPSRFADDSPSAKRSRKFQACRAPSLCLTSSPLSSSTSSSETKLFPAKTVSVPLITTSVPHWAPQGSHPLIDPASGKRSHIYSLVNDRYPGAPGTALAKARDAHQKSIQLAKREAAKKLASKAELEHLGVKGLGKKRKSSSPYATVGNTSHHPTSSSHATTSTTAATSVAMSRDASTQSRSRNAAKTSTDGNTLAVPSSSRNRRPTSRATSPAPLTSQPSAGRRSGTRSGSAVPADEDTKSASAPPSRGSSPPEGSKAVLGLASTAPFQSSPLAASAITLEPLLDNDDTETPSINIETSPSAGRSGAMKRKASALNQELRAEDVAENEDTNRKASHEDVSDDLSKGPEQDTDAADATPSSTNMSLAVRQDDREGSPSSISSSRRTSPRMSSRRIVSEVA